MASRILIIDDEPHIRETMKLTLDSAGYQVSVAADGPSGLNAFGRENGWDLVLLDQRMPGMEGLEVLRRLRERDPAARIIMVTAFATVELAVDAMKAGAQDFLRKPFTPQVLRDTVAATLARPKEAPETSGAAARPGPNAAVRDEPLTTFRSLNGFEFWPVRRARAGGTGAAGAIQRRFEVRTPSHRTVVCTVEISPDAANRVRAEARGQVSAQDRIWDALSRHALAEFLWERAESPPERLTVPALSPRHWEIVQRLLPTNPL